MHTARLMRMLRWALPGMMLLQTTGCNFQDFNELLQTVFLGVTAAGAIAILQNI